MLADAQAGSHLDPRIERAVAGDRAALDAIVRELLPRTRNLVRYLLRGDADVDDAAQNALLAILRGLPSFRGEAPLRAWADRITAREALAYARRRRALRSREGMPEDEPSGRDSEQPDVLTLRRQTVALVDALPDEQREVVVLHHVVGLSVPELAESLGIPFETARSRLRLAMAKLRSLTLVSSPGSST